MTRALALALAVCAVLVASAAGPPLALLAPVPVLVAVHGASRARRVDRRAWTVSTLACERRRSCRPQFVASTGGLAPVRSRSRAPAPDGR